MVDPTPYLCFLAHSLLCLHNKCAHFYFPRGCACACSQKVAVDRVLGDPLASLEPVAGFLGLVSRGLGGVKTSVIREQPTSKAKAVDEHGNRCAREAQPKGEAGHYYSDGGGGGRDWVDQRPLP